MSNFKPIKQDKDPAYLTQVRGLPCCICEAFGFEQTSRTTAHHTICGRFSQSKTPDFEAIPLCDCHHQGMRYDRDRAKLAIHRGKESWEAAYGADTDYIDATFNKIMAQVFD